MQAINKIILGTVQFGLDYGINNKSGKPVQDVVNQILIAAIKAGVNCLDTAEAYGNAHEVIGQFHATHPGQMFDVITKLPHHIDENIDEKIERYLAELGVKQLHGLLFHSYQSYIDNLSSIQLLNGYKKRQIVRYIGVSVYTNKQMEQVIADENIDIIQLPFNLFDNIIQRGELIDKAKSRGKIIHTRSAFLQGLFFAPLQSENKIINALSKQLTYIHELSEAFHIPLQQMALNYCLQQPGINNVLIGVDNLEQLNQNLNYAGNSLADSVVAAINKISVTDVDLLNPSLWNQ